MYIAEGVPTVLIGIVTLFVMTDRPAQAKFLTDEEKTWLIAKLASERTAKEAVRKFSILEGMFDPKVLLMALNYFGIVVASLGILFFVPQIIKSIGVTDNMTVGWLTMIPYISGGVGLVSWGWCLRPHERAALEPARRVRGLDDRVDYRRSDDRLVVGDGRPVDRHVRVLWLEGTVLVDAADVHDRNRCRCFPGVDQLHRQPRWLLRTLVRWRGKRLDQ